MPFAAVLNAVGKHLLMKEPEEELHDDLEESAEEGSAPANA